MRSKLLLAGASLLLAFLVVGVSEMVSGGERLARPDSSALESDSQSAQSSSHAAHDPDRSSEVHPGELPVDRREPVASPEPPLPERHLDLVVIRAADQRPLPGFEVALVQDDDALARAVTDADGRARLAVADDVVGIVRAQPHGWVGPLVGFPELDAARLPDEPLILTVPAFGFVEFMLLRESAPAPDDHEGWSRVEGWEAELQQGLAPELAGDAKVQVHRDYAATDRLRVGPIGLGLEFHCILVLDGLPGTLWNRRTTGPIVPGEEVAFPIELGPDRGHCSVLLLAPDGEPLHNVELDTCGLYLGSAKRPAWRPVPLHGQRTDAEGRAEISLRGRWGEGVVLQRLSLGVGRLHGTLEVGHFPEPGEDLGVLRFAEPEPTVSGVVFGPSGAALEAARVSLVMRGGLHRRTTVGGPEATGRDGRFALFKDLRGAGPMRLHVEPVDGGFYDHGVVKPGEQVEVRVREQGAVEASFQPTRAVDVPMPVVELRRGMYPVSSEGREVWDGRRAWWQEGLPAGTVDFVLRNGAYGEDLVVIDGVVVPERGVADDPRLRDIRLDGLIRRVELLVLDSKGRPLGGAELTRPIQGEPSSWRSKEDREVSAADGSVVFLVPGSLDEIEVRVEAERHAAQKILVPVGRGSRTVVRLERG